MFPYQLRNLKQGNNGFSLLELIVVISITAVLAGILLSRIPQWQAQAEKAAMNSVVGALRSALGIKVAAYVAKNNVDAIYSLSGGNPMEYLAETPINYLGVISGAGETLAGSWYFDPAAHTIVYRVRNEAFFSGGMAEPGRARFRIDLVFANAVTKRKQRRHQPSGVRLAAVERYEWSL
ncbi:MAG: hypothetical protein BMS9Abin36_1568 [Gammaproteobacteria bacterium]|nr:MAG: hypothetical protein BMS9Abin36_1568 [Gammaproteobacteria bacterium]